ncbi:MAG: carboxypeptidase-like regulatory domain-containing protein [Pirellulaceae bacterium]|jgi:hypothetical protein|nr:carboxypeptidase-like regulatory domain-containing protein [Pirellulaceae bacterium]MDP7018907.1 carboxypeptidase-like regulatory domain-containing protein [Pirellulaceae bacterium]
MSRKTQWLLVAIACVNFVVPAHLVAAERVGVRDLALGEGGVLRGQVVAPTGVAVPQTAVTLSQQRRPVAQVTTDAQGRFELRGVRGGVYELTAGGQVGVYRCWAARTAPPSAKQHALLVAGDVERGQQPISALVANPLVIGLVIAAAIAIPIVVNNSNNAPAS